ncbi:MAG: UDP-N-acetylmuramate dehydrogenase [Clostridia bacterium]|nr:UDP-N-acetylmuramate dehydrogenase [Clostridia bacterium]
MFEKDLYIGYEDFLIERPFDFSLHSSIGCGGCAKIAFYPRSEDELIALLSRLESEGRRYLVVGNLTNVLPSDLGTDKAVVCTKKLNAIKRISESLVYAESGILSGALLDFLRREGLEGAEFLSGIPCTLGGALYMNAGVSGAYMQTLVENVRIYSGGRVQTLTNGDCAYAYKDSVFMQGGRVIIGATLRLKESSPDKVFIRQREYIQKRVRLPKGKSMGCVFKNTQSAPAGELIDKAGLKGMRVGGAIVSKEHANFIINDKKATAREIKSLITLVKNAVYAQYGVCLEEEIRYLE